MIKTKKDVQRFEDDSITLQLEQMDEGEPARNSERKGEYK
jgi:hypothetical protein